MKTIEDVIKDKLCVACSNWDRIETTVSGACKLDGYLHHCSEIPCCEAFNCASTETITKRLDITKDIYPLLERS